jgi:hypothetical protein
MNNPAKIHRDGNQFEILDLVSCTCPSCRLVTWHSRKSKLNQEIFCPFCHQGLPAYLTKVSPEKMDACDEGQPGPGTVREREMSPFVLEFFMVQGSGFRCMAYRNGDGKWHEAFNNQELPGAVRILQ